MPRYPLLAAPLAIFSLTLILSTTSCRNGHTTPRTVQDTIAPPPGEVEDASIPGNFSSPGKLRFDSTLLDAFLKKYPELATFRTDLTQFYAGRGWAYAWYDDQGIIESSQDLYNRVSNMTDEGIPFKVPYYERYKDMIDGTDSTGAGTKPDPEKELMLSSQYFNFARKVWSGLPPSATQKVEWYVPRKKLEYNKLLDVHVFIHVLCIVVFKKYIIY